jgi:hypothetical protein
MGLFGALKRVLFRTSTANAEQIRKQPPTTADIPEPNKPTLGDMQNAPLPNWMTDVCNGFEFIATLQLRTPLRVLRRHGELYQKNDGKQPQIVCNQWEGIWVPKKKTWHELGIDFEEMGESTHASSIGYVLPTEYLPFLIAVREIVELPSSIEHRIQKLRQMLFACAWQEFVVKHGGIEAIVQEFFPRHIAPMPRLPEATREELRKLGLVTTNLMAVATDERLLGVKGIGPAKLKAIRAYCADMVKHPDADRVENVYR